MHPSDQSAAFFQVYLASVNKPLAGCGLGGTRTYATGQLKLLRFERLNMLGLRLFGLRCGFVPTQGAVLPPVGVALAMAE